MSRQRILLLWMLGVLFIVITVAIFPTSEPAYQGRSLSAWVNDWGRYGWHEPWKSRTIAPGMPIDARDAVYTMGTNAVPFLVDWICCPPAQFEIPFWGRHRRTRSSLAAAMIDYSSSIPDPYLARILTLSHDPDPRVSDHPLIALEAAAARHTNALELLLKDPSAPHQKAAIHALQRFADPGPYYPQVVKMMSHTNVAVAIEAVEYLMMDAGNDWFNVAVKFAKNDPRPELRARVKNFK